LIDSVTDLVPETVQLGDQRAAMKKKEIKKRKETDQERYVTINQSKEGNERGKRRDTEGKPMGRKSLKSPPSPPSKKDEFPRKEKM